MSALVCVPQASRQLGSKVPREEKKLDYLDTLKRRYQHMPEIKRIAKHRHVPKVRSTRCSSYPVGHGLWATWSCRPFIVSFKGPWGE